MTTDSLGGPMPEWQLWAYRIKSELQDNINAFDSVLKEFQSRMISIDDGLNSKFDTLNGDLQLKGSGISNIMTDVAQLIEAVKETRTSLVAQELQVGILGETLATEQAISKKRYAEQITINRTIREDMQRAADHLTDLQMHAKQDADRKTSDIAILKAENEAIWPQLEELRAMLMQITTEEGEEEPQQDPQTGQQEGSGPSRQELVIADEPSSAVSSPPRLSSMFASGQNQLATDGQRVPENGHNDSQAAQSSSPQDPRRFSTELQLATRGHRSYKEYIQKGVQDVRAALAEEMKQLEEMYGKKFIWNLGNTQWRSHLWQELEETGWDWENVEARAMKMLEDKQQQRPRKRSRHYLEY